LKAKRSSAKIGKSIAASDAPKRVKKCRLKSGERWWRAGNGEWEVGNGEQGVGSSFLKARI